MLKTKQIVFDLETNGLLHEATTIWIFVAEDLSTGEQTVFSDEDKDAKPLKELPAFLDSCRLLSGHNILMYDVLILEKLLGWKPKEHHKLVDTMIMSQVLNYKRFGFGHSLAKWGEFFDYPKVEHEDWSQYSPEMRNRCVVDVKLNVKVYNYLVAELSSRKNKESLKLGLKVEHGTSRFVGRSILHGWPFDVEKAKEVRQQLEDKMSAIEQEINPKLKTKLAQIDRDPEFKSPAWIKTGNYAVRTASWFELDPARGQEEDRPVWGDYCRVELVHPDIGSMESVKALLYELGWEPDEWNYVKDTKGNPVKSSPKLTEASLEPLGKIGAMINEFYTLRSRHSILKTWMEENVTTLGRIHGDCFVIGTPTARSRHSIIANIPSADATFGPEIRSLFSSLPGYVIVGADSKGNQNRALAHYLNNKEYTEAICTGDIHDFNRKILESIVGSMGPDGRKRAKAFFYALIFAGGAGKLALIVTGRRDASIGQKIKDEFLKKIPGLNELVTKLEKMFDATNSKTGKGYIMALDGRPVFMEGKRLALNYLLQSFEKITVAAAIDALQEELDSKGFDWQPLIVYHDECQFLVREDQAEAAKEIALKAFREAPKQLGAMIMDGSAAIGKNWYETH
jgi:DNA polymerase I-like protein with 3'-5' exonuclease and polymerase domains